MKAAKGLGNTSKNNYKTKIKAPPSQKREKIPHIYQFQEIHKKNLLKRPLFTKKWEIADK